MVAQKRRFQHRADTRKRQRASRGVAYEELVESQQGDFESGEPFCISTSPHVTGGALITKSGERQGEGGCHCLEWIR